MGEEDALLVQVSDPPPLDNRDKYKMCIRDSAMHRRFLGNGHPKVAEDLIDLGATQMERCLLYTSRCV